MEGRNSTLKYIWCEDKGSGYIFWKELFAELCPEAIVETKQNNSSLRKAVESIQDDDNMYYIFMDYAVDNPDVLRESNRLEAKARDRKNVVLVKIHSFEFALLSFEYLVDWIYAEEDELKDQRKALLEFRKIFVKLFGEGGSTNELLSLKELNPYKSKKNSEQISSRLLFDITRNTGFETDKKNLGHCFIVDCCKWDNRQDDDICGLDVRRITSVDKKKMLVEYSILKRKIEEVCK